MFIFVSIAWNFGQEQVAQTSWLTFVEKGTICAPSWAKTKDAASFSLFLVR